MSLRIGNIDTYEVIKETDIAYTLNSLDENETTDIFLHFNQTKNRLNIGQKVEAFLYYDQKKRLCATTETPLITTTKAAFCEVIAKHNSMGVFLNIGIAKDILLSSDFLPSNPDLWPQVGDKVPAIIKIKRDQLIAKMIGNTDVLPLNKIEVGTTVEATIYRISPEGITLCTPDFNLIFVHKSLLRNKYRLGQVISVKVIHETEKVTYNGSLIPNKELSRLDDSEIILQHLKTQGGSLPLGDKSSPEEIARYFPFSKSAFKRAIGNLYKQKLITIKENLITLNEK